MEGSKTSMPEWMDIMAYRARTSTRLACPHGKVCSAKPIIFTKKFPIYVHKTIRGDVALLSYRCAYADAGDCTYLDNELPSPKTFVTKDVEHGEL